LQDKRNYERALLWLFEKHPQHLLHNLAAVYQHGSLQTLLNLVMYTTVGNLESKYESRVLHAQQKGKIREETEKRKRRGERRQRQLQHKTHFAATVKGVPLDHLMFKPHTVHELLAARQSNLSLSLQALDLVISEKMVAKQQKKSKPPQQSAEASDNEDQEEEYGYEGYGEEEPASEKGPDFPAPKRGFCGSVAVKSMWLCGMDEYTAKRRVYNNRSYKWATKGLQQEFMQYMRQRQYVLREEAMSAKEHKAVAVRQRITKVVQEKGPAFMLRQGVARVFAKGLQMEFRQYQKNEPLGGLFAKWAPTPANMHDRMTDICSDIISLLPESVLCSRGETPVVKYQQLLSTLRLKACIPETFVGRADWNNIVYERLVIQYICIDSTCTGWMHWYISTNLF
jgi:hypothetical protein